MADLKKRLRLLEDLEMPERWESIRARPPRVDVDPDPARRQRPAVIVLALVLTVATIAWLGSAFGRSETDRPLESPTVTDSPSPPPSLEPAPTMDPKAVDLGLGFGLCMPSRARGDFTGTGLGTAWFGTRTDEDTLQCRSSSHRHVLAVDVDEDGTAEGWINPIGPNVCWTWCELEGVSDLDGDGTHEIVVLVEGASVASYGVFDVDAMGRPEPIGFLGGGAPTDLPQGLAKLVVGGDEAFAAKVTCEPGPDGPLITQYSLQGVVEQEELGATVRTTRFRLTPEGFDVLQDDIAEGVLDPPDLSGDSRLCDLDLGAR